MADCGPAMVAAACIVRDQQVLLAKRHQPSIPAAHGRWELPGGKVEHGEAPDKTVVREILEELGVSIYVVRLLPHVQSSIYRHSEGSLSHAVVIAFECALSSVDPRINLQEAAVTRVHWFHPNDLPSLDEMLPGTEKFIRCLSLPDQVSYSTE